MFSNPAMNQAQLIGWVLDNRPLKNPPGSVYEYLNFGFCVLGRVIEKVTAKPCQEYVKGAVLAKCGISRMADRRRHSRRTSAMGERLLRRRPVRAQPARMDARGGWIATPIDLVRLMARTDGFIAKADILTSVYEQIHRLEGEPGIRHRLDRRRRLSRPQRGDGRHGGSTSV